MGVQRVVVNTRGRRGAVVELAGMLGLCAAVMIAAPAASASTHVPDWVEQAVKQPLPDYPESTKAVVLLDEETYTVDANGKAVDHERCVIKILRPQGRDLARPTVYYDKDSKVESFHVWSIDPSGHEYQTKDDEIADVSVAAGFEAYADERAKVANPPGLDPGGVIAYEYEVKERPYLAEVTWGMQGEMPELQQSFKLVLPAGFTYTTTWSNHAPEQPADLENHSYLWQANNEPGIDLDQVSLAPSTGSLAARMTVHYAGPGLAQAQEGTWQGIGEWYAGLIKDRLSASPEIAAEAQELTAGKTDFFDKVQAIAEFMQTQIRYVAVEVGIGGYQPHAADAVFKNRYGDCKDKATLLAAMLSAVGIHSTLVLVDVNRGVVDPNDPSIWGDHMIAAIEIPRGYESPKMHSVVTAKTGKRYLIFDPTWYETPFGQIEDNLQGGYGVLMEGADSQVIQFPVMPPALNHIDREGQFTLEPDGTLQGSVVEKRFGDVAERRRSLVTGEDQQHVQVAMENWIASDFAAVTMTGLKFAHADSLNQDLETSFNLSAPRFAMETGPLLMVRPRIFGSDDFPLDHRKRSFPVDLGAALEAKDDFTIQVPNGYEVESLPDPVNVDMGFAAYVSRCTLQGRTLHYTSQLTVRAVTLPADQYGELRKLTGIIGSDENSEAILRRAAVTAAVDSGALKPSVAHGGTP